MVEGLWDPTIVGDTIGKGHEEAFVVNFTL